LVVEDVGHEIPVFLLVQVELPEAVHKLRREGGKEGGREGGKEGGREGGRGRDLRAIQE